MDKKAFIHFTELNQNMDKIKLSLSFALLLLIVLTIPTIVYFNNDNSNLRKQVGILQEEISILKTANITTALGIVEVPPNYANNIWGSNFSHVWITGWVFNSGASPALDAGLRVIASNETGVIMNKTIPLVAYGTFSTNENKIKPNNENITPYTFENILSHQNVTIRIAIYHEDLFSSSTKYEIIPIWKNIT